MINRVALVFPIVPGKTEADIRRIAERFNAEPEAYFESRRRAGVTLERAYWQHTPMGTSSSPMRSQNEASRRLSARTPKAPRRSTGSSPPR